MGTYINPPNMTKEEWLRKNATAIPKNEFLGLTFDAAKASGKYPCVLMNNGPFTAAAVADSAGELAYWHKQLANDTRPMTFYVAPIDGLKEVT